MIVPIMALYAREIGATVAIIGLIIGMYSMVNTPANVFFGSLIDRFGYKVLLILGFVGDSICMFLYTLCHAPQHLLLVRGIHGLTGAILGPATMFLVVQYSRPKRGARSMGLYGMAMGLAPLIGFMLSGMIIRYHLGFPVVFYTGSLLLLVGVILVLLLPKAKGREDRGQSGSIGVKRIVVLAKRGPIAASYASIFSQWFVFGGITVLLPLYMKGLGMTAFHFSMVLIALTLTFVALQYPFGFLSDKIGRKTPSVIGLVLISIGLWLFPMVTSFKALILTGILCGVGIGSLFPSIAAMLSDNTEEGERGIATGIFHALITGGVAVGAPVMGLVAKWVGVSLAIVLSSLVPIASIFVILALVKGHTRSSAEI